MTAMTTKNGATERTGVRDDDNLQVLKDFLALKQTDVGDAADALNEELHRGETALRKKQFGVRAEVVLKTVLDGVNGYEDEQMCSESLVFDKNYGEWGLSLLYGLTDGRDGRTRSDLFAANLELRTLAALAMPRLVQALVTAKAERHSVVVAATSELSKFLDQLESS